MDASHGRDAIGCITSRATKKRCSKRQKGKRLQQRPRAVQR